MRIGRDDGAGMPLTYSIATALRALKRLSGPLSPAVLLIGAVFVLHFALG
jgi:hypothetical protein